MILFSSKRCVDRNAALQCDARVPPPRTSNRKGFGDQSLAACENIGKLTFGRSAARRMWKVSFNPLDAVGPNPFTRVLKSVAENGLVHTIIAIAGTVVDVHFDLCYGTDTLRRVELTHP